MLRPDSMGFKVVDYRKLKKPVRDALPIDDQYETDAGTRWDVAYVAFYQGIIATDENCLASENGEYCSPADEYRFVRKYFSKPWYYLLFAIRCCQLNNPIVELRAFLSTRKTRPTNLWAHVKRHGKRRATSSIPTSLKKVSVVIPTLNRYKYLGDALYDLEAQTYANFDVYVIDQSEPFDQGFYGKFDLSIHVIRQAQPALWKARNDAVKSSDADLLLLFDDDSRVEENWIERHVAGLTDFGADVSSGVSLSVIGDEVPKSYQIYRQADQLDTGNALVRRSVFEKIGLFDEQFEGQRMGDAEFGLRAFLAGFQLISNPEAQRIHLKVPSGGLRQMGSWDAFRPKSLLAPRPVPSVLYLFRRYFGKRDALIAMLVMVPPSFVPYKHKSGKKLKVMSCIVAAILSPIVIVQCIRSWMQATEKVNEGPRIPQLAAIE